MTESRKATAVNKYLISNRDEQHHDIRYPGIGHVAVMNHWQARVSEQAIAFTTQKSAR
jgi:hypothetical protein